MSFCLSGCSSMAGKYERNYLEAKSIKPITVPSGMSSSSIESAHPVPNIKSKQPLKPPSLLPPGTKVDSAVTPKSGK